jgi:hypothetical protein
MKHLVQLAVAFVATGLLGELTFGTPFYAREFLGAVFVGVMFLVALVQHWLHWRRPS